MEKKKNITSDYVVKALANLPQLVFEVTDVCNLRCMCSCYWENQGGSSSDDNMSANYSLGDGTYSEHGCNQYWMVGSGIMDCNSINTQVLIRKMI